MEDKVKSEDVAINEDNYLCDCPFCGKKVYKHDDEKGEVVPVHDYISEVFAEVMKRQPN